VGASGVIPEINIMMNIRQVWIMGNIREIRITGKAVKRKPFSTVRQVRTAFTMMED
jgi:hypothetical protein